MLSLNSSIQASGLVLLWALGSAWAHPFHISSAEVEYDPKTDRLQVSLKVQALDIEQALSKLASQRIKLEQADVDRLLVDYLSAHFYLAQQGAAAEQAGGKLESSLEQPLASLPANRSRVHWLGRELKGAWLWLYFELEIPEPLAARSDPDLAREDLHLINTILCETNSRQINTVSVRHAGQRTTLKMTSQQPSEKFLSLWLTP